MANFIYTKYFEHVHKAEANWISDNYRVLLVDTADYTVDLDNHNTLTDIPSGAIVAASGNITGKTLVGRAAFANDVMMPPITGDTAEALVVYRHTGNSSTSWLAVYIDTAVGLALTPTGASALISWPDEGVIIL